MYCNKSNLSDRISCRSLGWSFQVNVVYTDLNKAFDTVNFDLLLVKLKAFGTKGSVFDLVKSYFRIVTLKLLSEDVDLASLTLPLAYLKDLYWNHCCSCFTWTTFLKFSGLIIASCAQMIWKCIAKLRVKMTF